MFVSFVYFLYLLPHNVVNDFRIDIVIDSIAVLDFSVILGVMKHFVNCLLGQVLTFLGAYSALLHLFGNIRCCIVLRIQTENLFNNRPFNRVDNIFLVNDIVTE